MVTLKELLFIFCSFVNTQGLMDTIVSPFQFMMLLFALKINTLMGWWVCSMKTVPCHAKFAHLMSNANMESEKLLVSQQSNWKRHWTLHLHVFLQNTHFWNSTNLILIQFLIWNWFLVPFLGITWDIGKSMHTDKTGQTLPWPFLFLLN